MRAQNRSWVALNSEILSQPPFGPSVVKALQTGRAAFVHLANRYPYDLPSAHRRVRSVQGFAHIQVQHSNRVCGNNLLNV